MAYKGGVELYTSDTPPQDLYDHQDRKIYEISFFEMMQSPLLRVYWISISKVPKNCTQLPVLIKQTQHLSEFIREARGINNFKPPIESCVNMCVYVRKTHICK